MKTENTQPCLFAMELSAVEVLKDKRIFPEAVAGFRLVCIRGKLMQHEAEKYETFMAAVLKLPANEVCKICGYYSDIYPMNFNCPEQITVSSLTLQMPEFLAEVKEAGGKVILLKVKGAFHSPFMNLAANDFSAELSKSKYKNSKIPLYSNLTALLYPENPVQILSGKICNPV